MGVALMKTVSRFCYILLYFVTQWFHDIANRCQLWWTTPFLQQRKSSTKSKGNLLNESMKYYKFPPQIPQNMFTEFFICNTKTQNPKRKKIGVFLFTMTSLVANDLDSIPILNRNSRRQKSYHEIIHPKISNLKYNNQMKKFFSYEGHSSILLTITKFILYRASLKKKIIRFQNKCE